jgi:hypothetical protein
MESLYALSLNVLVTLAIQQHLKYQFKALFETPCIIDIQILQMTPG